MLNEDWVVRYTHQSQTRQKKKNKSSLSSFIYACFYRNDFNCLICKNSASKIYWIDRRESGEMAMLFSVERPWNGFERYSKWFRFISKKYSMWNIDTRSSRRVIDAAEVLPGYCVFAIYAWRNNVINVLEGFPMYVVRIWC